MAIAEGERDAFLSVLWGKSNAAGRMNLLLQHCLDAAAVGELVWDRFLAPSIRRWMDECCDGRGRELFVLVCGLHDVGKATPAFQQKNAELAAAVRRSGLSWPVLDQLTASAWHHTLAGAHVLRSVLPAAGWPQQAVDWLWPLIGGHHGVVPAGRSVSSPPGRRGSVHGDSRWAAAQKALVNRVAAEIGVDLSSIAPARVPSRAQQLAVSGAVIMADWIASSAQPNHFPGVDDLGRVSMAVARERAERAWADLRLRGGWAAGSLSVFPDQIRARFGKPARAAQADAVALARDMPAPGLLLVEAPMGEGKTELALAVAEVLASMFGADGVFVGMPTQATSDPMYSVVLGWANRIEQGIPVGLLHGKRRFNAEWKRLQREVEVCGVDEYGCAQEPRGRGAGYPPPQLLIPPEWLLGRNRGLLCALTVGTVDHLLYAATRTRHVMLRHAGLAGRVVVLDEVHAYDIYMAQFLFEALRWLADGGVPVVLLSATLPPELRRKLVTAYLQGALQKRDVDLSGLPEPDGYPSALSVCAVDGEARFAATSSPSWRESRRVGVQILPEDPSDGPAAVVAELTRSLHAGGCALVIRNTVARAQETYTAVKAAFGDDAVLLHARLTAGERTDRTEKLLKLLGPPDREGSVAAETESTPRPRLVVVATQLAEQSFDVDVDLLITDLAPIDLLLQRIGRLHRHDRPDGARPSAVVTPRVVVTGMTTPVAGPPDFPRGSLRVYGEHLLLRAAALVGAGAETGWSVPADVPRLVADGYGDDSSVLPGSWWDRAATVRSQWLQRQEQRQTTAEQYLLAPLDDLGTPTLAGLHTRSVAEADDDEVSAAVRDGDESIEVVLVQCTDDGYQSLTGRWLGPRGELAATDEGVLEEVVGCTVRLPAYPAVTAQAVQQLRPLPGWDLDPWLARARALELNGDRSADLGGYRLRYDDELGLLVERRTSNAK